MPAAELTRLRVQINELILRFGDPAAFCSALRNLLDLYSNRAYRAGQVVQPQALIPTYRVPPLVTRQLDLELSKTCQEQPVQALSIIEALWKDPYLEPRLLGCTLLGALPAQMGPDVLEKVRAWARPGENFRMLEALFKHGTIELRRSNTPLLLSLVEEWLNSSNHEIQAMGLRALTPIVGDRDFENLPAIFRLLGSLVQNIPSPLQADLYSIVIALIERSPIETAYFLRQSLPLTANSNTARLVRRCLPSFNPAQQASLRAALQAANPS